VTKLNGELCDEHLYNLIITYYLLLIMNERMMCVVVVERNKADRRVELLDTSVFFGHSLRC